MTKENLPPYNRAAKAIVEILTPFYSQGLDFKFENDQPALYKDGRLILCCQELEENSILGGVGFFYPEAEEPGKGYGKIYYLLSARQLESQGEFLCSTKELTDEGEGIWKSLVKRGLATVTDDEYAGPQYRFIELANFDFTALQQEAKTEAQSQKISHRLRETIKLIQQCLKEAF